MNVPLTPAVVALLGAAAVGIDVLFVCRMKVGDLQFVVCAAILLLALFLQRTQVRWDTLYAGSPFVPWRRVLNYILPPEGLGDLVVAVKDLAITILLGTPS